MPNPCNAEFLGLRTTDMWSQLVLCCGRMLSSIPDFWHQMPAASPAAVTVNLTAHNGGVGWGCKTTRLRITGPEVSVKVQLHSKHRGHITKCQWKEMFPMSCTSLYSPWLPYFLHTFHVFLSTCPSFPVITAPCVSQAPSLSWALSRGHSDKAAKMLTPLQGHRQELLQVKEDFSQEKLTLNPNLFSLWELLPPF